MHLLLTDRGTEPFLIQELRRAFPLCEHRVRAPGLVASDFFLQPELPPNLVFSRQFLPEAEPRQAESISRWAQLLAEALSRPLSHPSSPEQPWHLHIVSKYGSGSAGQNRCRLIRQALTDLLHRRNRRLLRALQADPCSFQPEHSLLQLLLTAPNTGFISLAPAPLPFQCRRLIWPFRAGEISPAVDKAAPSRAFAKLLEAEQRLGRGIRPGETCVDLGASPGSWSYVALQRGARVLAVDRAPLREDLMRHSRLVFRQGDAFKFEPDEAVDWLLCDVIAAPLRSVDLLLNWVRRKLAARFVVTIKFKGATEYGLLERLKHGLPPFCDDFCLTHLCANKNEVCAFGKVRDVGPRALPTVRGGE